MRVAIVTGAARNIGAAIAERLAADGYAVAAVDVLAEPLAETVRRIEKDGGRALAIEADVSQAAAVASIVERVVAELGPPSALVNNAAAGVAREVPWDEDDVAAWEQILRVNVLGAFLCSCAAIPHLRDTQGAIVNVSSNAALAGYGRNLPYVASKGALIAMTRAMAREDGYRGVRVNCVLPGKIDTPEQEAVFGAPGERWWQPLQTAGAPGDVAGTVSFLLSDDARFVTGQCLVVDGGVMMP